MPSTGRSTRRPPSSCKPSRPPFAAHAWVEAEGVLVGEGAPADYFQRFFAVE
ncbi:lasso peptide biosynthesis protein [Streptomyces triculaminicus]|uniref:lasso peptide biosynthesis protein n=1 Tax=Streptomyces triculaminicus TaxID=2816232 RepID=UPI0037CE4128